MPPASLSTDAKSEARGAESTARSRRARRKPQPRRWMREAQGIVALAVATFVFVALTVFDPAVPPGHQAALVGPVGIWLVDTTAMVRPGSALSRLFGSVATSRSKPR